MPEWTLGAAVIGAGSVLWAASEPGPGDGRRIEEMTAFATGLGVLALGTWMTWIGPAPEPPSAWAATAGVALLTSGLRLGCKERGPRTRIAIEAGTVWCAAMGLTFIARGSPGQFG